MARVIAVTQIHQTIEPGKTKTATEAGKPPKVRVIPAGTVFTVTGSYEQELRDAGAIRDPQKGEKVAVDYSQAPLHVEDDDDAEARVLASKEATDQRKRGRRGPASLDAPEGPAIRRGSAVDTEVGDGSELV